MLSGLYLTGCGSGEVEVFFILVCTLVDAVGLSFQMLTIKKIVMELPYRNGTQLCALIWWRRWKCRTATRLLML